MSLSQINRRLLAPAAIQTSDNSVLGVDTEAFVRRVLLFNTYILDSVWLEEFKFLEQVFHPEEIALLLDEGALNVHCESLTIGETGRARADLNFTDDNTRLPLGSYSYSSKRVSDHDKRVETALLKHPQFLQDAIRKRLVGVTPKELSTAVFDGFYSDLRRDGAEMITTALKQLLASRGVKARRLDVRILEMKPEDFRVDTNLQSQYGLSEMTAHERVGQAMMAIAVLNGRLARTMLYGALSGTNEQDVELLRTKVATIANFVPVRDNDNRMARVLRIVGVNFPRVTSKVNAEKLLKMREADELRAFRDWLEGTDELSEAEIRERLTSLSGRLQTFLGNTKGKMLRFAASTTAGALGPVAGFIAGAIDSFVLDRFARKDFVISFVSDSYPSLFDSKPR